MDFQPGGSAALGGSGIRLRPDINTPPTTGSAVAGGPFSQPPSLTPYGHTGIADPLSLSLVAGADEDSETDLVINGAQRGAVAIAVAVAEAAATASLVEREAISVEGNGASDFRNREFVDFSDDEVSLRPVESCVSGRDESVSFDDSVSSWRPMQGHNFVSNQCRRSVDSDFRLRNSVDLSADDISWQACSVESHVSGCNQYISFRELEPLRDDTSFVHLHPVQSRDFVFDQRRRGVVSSSGFRGVKCVSTL